MSDSLLSQLSIGTAPASFSWEPGQRVTGPTAWMVATLVFKDLLPPFPDGARFPLAVAPPPPLFLPEENATAKWVRHLHTLYNTAASWAYETKVLVYPRSMPVPIYDQLENAALFFAGLSRPGIKEWNGTKRVVPEHIAPAAWVGWSLHAWRHGGQDPKRAATRPRIDWVYSPQRLANDKLVKIFTHARYDLRAQPFSCDVREEAISQWTKMRDAIMFDGISGELDVLRIVRAHFPPGAFEKLSAATITQADKLAMLVADQAARGQWVWHGSAR